MINWIISSSCLILIVLVVRRLFAGKIRLRLQYALWLLVALRLIIPINLGSSAISIENLLDDMSAQKQITESAESDVPEISDQRHTEGIKIYDSIADVRNEETGNLKESEQSMEPMESVVHTVPYQAEGAKEFSNADILRGIWITEMMIFGCVFLMSNLTFNRKMKKSRIMLYVMNNLIISREIYFGHLFAAFV